MDAAIDHGHKSVVANGSEWQESYKTLPFVYFGLLMVWLVLVGIWTLNTWTKRQWQTSNLQWVLTAVPVLKALVLGLSFIFWYSCLNLSACSFWVAFGVFVTRIFFETACFIAFLLISHGYCIMYEQLSISERRSIAGLASLLYLTLTGYKAAVPQFAVLVVVIYFVLLYVIFLHVSKNLNVLREQLQHIQDEGVQLMQTAVHTKYSMFKKFQGAMLMIVVAEILMHTRADGAANEYWIRLLIREWAEIGIFFYIGWTFRSREVTPFFTVIPTLHSPDHQMLPPIYSIEMNQNEFNNLDFKDWHIGVVIILFSFKYLFLIFLEWPTSPPKGDDPKPLLVIVRNPGLSSHEDQARKTKSGLDHMPRRGFNLSSCKQAVYSKSDFKGSLRKDNTTTAPLSPCILDRFLNQEMSKSTYLSESECAVKYHSCWKSKDGSDVFFSTRDYTIMPAVLRDNLKSHASHQTLWGAHVELEPFFSHLV